MKKNIVLTIITAFGGYAYGIAQTGNVGINTANPTEKLHVKGSLRFESSDAANPAAIGKSLVSDANGNATWRVVKLTAQNYHPTYGTASTQVINYYDTSSSLDQYYKRLSPTIYTGTSISLPPGKWIVFLSLVARVQYAASRAANPTWTDLPADKGVWVRTSFGDNQNGSGKNTEMVVAGISADIQGSNLVSGAVTGPSSAATITGELFITNTTSSNKTYYLKVSNQIANMDGGTDQIRLTDFGLAPDVANNRNLSNKIIAYPIN